MFVFFLLIVFFAHYVDAQKPLTEIIKNSMVHDRAKTVLDTAPYQPQSPAIITEHERKEFQLNRLISIIDRTQTSFGRWALSHLLNPIADLDEIMQRKDIILFLVEHEKELLLFSEQLKKIHSVEKSLLSYWDKDDVLDRDSQQFYFSDPLDTGIASTLNKSSIALNAGVGMQMFAAFKGLFLQLSLGGVTRDWELYYTGQQDNFSLWRGLKLGFAEPLRYHDPRLFKLKDKSLPYVHQDAVGGTIFGSWGDRYALGARGSVTDPAALGLSPWFMKWFIGWWWPTYNKKTGLFDTTVESPGILSKAYGVVTATLPTALYDYVWITSVVAGYRYIASMNKNLRLLQERILNVATALNTIKSAIAIVQNQEGFFGDHYITGEYDEQLSQLLTKISDPRFSKKDSYTYSRGHMLMAHKDIKDAKKQLVPLLQSIAFLDAFCSIAQLYKEYQDKPVTFKFPTFVDQQAPLMLYEDAWLPLLPYQKAVANDFCFGGECPAKMIITGPNGGGKSTLLKTFGVAAILAQSGFPVPATHAEQVLFAGIKTGLAPREDLEKNMSKGMAERKRIVDLLDAMRKSELKKENILVLIDEPYAGTVDDVAGEKIYDLGKDVESFSHVLLAIATHNKKPTRLEADTQGVFGNYQVRIREKSFGVFERLFKFEKGSARWWFEDAAQRRRFLDWLDDQPLDSH